jgi:hypothetical protein
MHAPAKRMLRYPTPIGILHRLAFKPLDEGMIRARPMHHFISRRARRAFLLRAKGLLTFSVHAIDWGPLLQLTMCGDLLLRLWIGLGSRDAVFCE